MWSTMVELIEYLLVFGVTVSLSAFSLLIIGGSLPIVNQSQARAQLEEITGAAGLAALKGNATLVLPLSNASASCSQGTMSLSSGGSTYSSPVGYGCSFQFKGVSCLCTMVFSRSPAGVVLRVVS